MSSRLMVVVTVILISLAAFGITMTVLKCGSDRAEQLTEIQALSVWGAQTCDSRWYSVSCKLMDANEVPTGCVGASPCSGTCYYCNGGSYQNYCDKNKDLNCLGCSTSSGAPLSCGEEYVGSCHMQDNVCVCPSTGDQPSGYVCPDWRTYSCPSCSPAG
jgi:hypothetical protein